jgi:hypothetical protein
MQKTNRPSQQSKSTDKTKTLLPRMHISEVKDAATPFDPGTSAEWISPFVGS